ncbi:hypothetical protein [Hamadaea tsunoensis]|uniref:hypothetical protein n=1 Tax=Hamadaea tsunoensis TaxID=53368 RepID=UPI0012FA5214|nr:hypothetical protein [Hamadaea tsunoensis]
MALVFTVERDWQDGIWTITLAGDYAHADHVDLRRTVARCLADRPATIILNLQDVRSTDPLLPHALATEERRAQREEVSLVCALNDELATTVRAARIANFLTVYPSVAVAHTLVAGAATHRWLHVLVEDIPSTVSHCRNRVTAACLAWGVWPVQDAVRSVTTELVGNALRYAGGRAEVTFTLRRGLVRIGVHDFNATLPVLPSPVGVPALGAGRMRGLDRVAATATTWGARKTPRGKVVWAAIRVGPSSSA